MSHEKEQWVEEVLAAADKIQRAKAPSHFYAQTMARIKEEASVSRDYILRITAGILLLVALNVFACVSFSKNSGAAVKHPLEAFASEYGIAGGGDSF
jgi:hypothetical protein